MTDSVTILGLRLEHPVCVASGMITDLPRQIDRLFGLGAAAVVTKTLYAGPRRLSDEKIRSFAHGAVNSTTFSHRPLGQWLTDLSDLATRHRNLIVSLHGETPERLGQLARQVAEVCPYPFELGISCPTDGSDGVLDADLVRRYVEAAKAAADRPVSVKLCADGRAPALARAAALSGADALSISDSLPGLLLVGEPPRPACRGETGYSGPGIKPLVLHAIRQVRRSGVELPILGIGGVSEGRDISDYLACGCVAAQVYTELMVKGDRRLATLVAEWRQLASAGPVELATVEA